MWKFASTNKLRTEILKKIMENFWNSIDKFLIRCVFQNLLQTQTAQI